MMFEQDIDELKFSEIVKLVKSLDDKEEDWIPLKLAFLHNIMIDPIVPYIKFLCFKENFKARIYMGDYDNVMQDVLNPGSLLYKHQPEVVVLALSLENLSESLVRSFANLALAEVEEESTRILNYMDQVIREIKNR